MLRGLLSPKAISAFREFKTTNARREERVLNAYQSGILMLNKAPAELGYDAIAEASSHAAGGYAASLTESVARGSQVFPQRRQIQLLFQRHVSFLY